MGRYTRIFPARAVISAIASGCNDPILSQEVGSRRRLRKSRPAPRSGSYSVPMASSGRLPGRPLWHKGADRCRLPLSGMTWKAEVATAFWTKIASPERCDESERAFAFRAQIPPWFPTSSKPSKTERGHPVLPDAPLACPVQLAVFGFTERPVAWPAESAHLWPEASRLTVAGRGSPAATVRDAAAWSDTTAKSAKRRAGSKSAIKWEVIVTGASFFRLRVGGPGWFASSGDRVAGNLLFRRG